MTKKILNSCSQKSALSSKQTICYEPDDYLIRIETCVRSAATLAFDSRLYVNRPHWELQHILVDAIQNGRLLDPYVICMAYCDGNPVGITVAVIKEDEIELNVYVIPEHRRHGLGTRMCNAIRFLLPPKTIVGSEGARGSITFFRSLK